MGCRIVPMVGTMAAPMVAPMVAPVVGTMVGTAAVGRESRSWIMRLLERRGLGRRGLAGWDALERGDASGEPGVEEARLRGERAASSPLARGDLAGERPSLKLIERIRRDTGLEERLEALSRSLAAASAIASTCRRWICKNGSSRERSRVALGAPIPVDTPPCECSV
jgi:hypothetical protein